MAEDGAVRSSAVKSSAVKSSAVKSSAVKSSAVKSSAVQALGDAHITFLFTDIEASTRAWEEHPAAMARALARHDELLHGAVKSAGGTVFKHTGDGLCVAFGTAPAAVAGAVTAALALHAEAWPAEAPLRVRMALHTGAVARRAGDYFGPALNRTARLMATAHGGQVVLSLVTAELVADALPPGAELLDLGTHRLADLARPERVFQLAHPGLPRAFEALRSLSSRRHNLPVAASSFVGRERELAAVTDLVRGARLVSLVGVGGVGKTRLALQVAAGLLDEYPDGVFFADLAPLADPALVPLQVAHAIGLIEAQARPDPVALLDGLCEHLAPRGVLLVIDNCEHVVDAAARLGEALLARCPDVAVLATSREPLATGGEIVWRVPSLALREARPGTLPSGDAVTLFCERAGAVDATFALEPGNAGAVARICRRLDGIPLAMELAAARVRVLTPDQIADRLDDCFRLLSAGPRTAVPRQQTLRATIDWSYDLLSAAERLLLQRLSVFAGSFDLAAVEGVVADGEAIAVADVLDLLTRLVDRSLVSARGRGHQAHYRLLETVRQYAAEKLAASGARDDAERAHRDHYLAYVTPYLQGDPFQDAANFPGALFRANLRAALDWSAARGDDEAVLRLTGSLGALLALCGSHIEGRTHLEHAAGLPVPVDDPARLRVLNYLGWTLALQGEADRALELHAEALARARAAGAAEEIGMAGYYLATRRLARGELAEARLLLDEAIASLRSVDAPEGVAWCEMMSGWIALADGDRATAARCFEITDRVGGGPTFRAHALGGAALLAAEAGDGERAARLAGEAVDAARGLGLQIVLTMALTRAAEVALLRGRLDEAAAVVTELLTVLGVTGGVAFLADALDMAALLEEGRNRPAAAAYLFGLAARVREAWQETPDERPVTPLLAACAARLEAHPRHGRLDAERVRAGEVPARQAATAGLARLAAPEPADARAPARPAPPAGVPTPGLLRRNGRRWEVGYGPGRFELPDAKGLGHLARLLAAPGTEIHVLDLVGAGPADRGDAGPLLDERAKAAYRERVRELRAEIEEAQAWNDPLRAERAQAELDALLAELAAGVGLGGRDRVACSAAERARIAVRKAIANAVARIAECDPDLGLLLTTTVKTGLYCRYVPDHRLPVTWEL